MPAALHPYLNFAGNAREVFEFYGEVLGATPQFATFGEFHAVPEGDPNADRIMHGSLEVTELIRLYVSDTLEKQMWGDLYGAFVDRFGIVWQVNISQGEEQQG